MNIFLRELKANRTALIIWSIGMFLGVLSGMSKYEAYSSGTAASEVLAHLPHSIRALFGMGSFNVSVMSGYFAFLFSYIVLLAAIHAVLLGSGIIAKEERDKTSEFLLVKPVSRTAVITAKLAAALVNVVILNIVTLLSSLYLVAYFNKGKDITEEIIVFLVSMFIVQLIFLAFGAFLAAIIKKPKASGALAVSILFGAYVIAKITDLADHLDALNILSPFKYFSYKDIVNGDGLSIVAVILSLLLAAAFSVSTYIFYRRRDLNV